MLVPRASTVLAITESRTPVKQPICCATSTTRAVSAARNASEQTNDGQPRQYADSWVGFHGGEGKGRPRESGGVDRFLDDERISELAFHVNSIFPTAHLIASIMIVRTKA